MNMIVRNPWNLLDQWHNEMGQLLNTPSGRDDTSLVEGSDWSPAVDIKEEDERFLIQSEWRAGSHPSQVCTADAAPYRGSQLIVASGDDLNNRVSSQ